MAKPDSIAVLLGGKPPEEEEEHEEHGESGEGEEDYSDLTPKEIAQHEHKSAEALLTAISDGDSHMLLQAFKALHGLDHASWDAEGEGGEEGDDEHEDEEGPPDEAA